MTSENTWNAVDAYFTDSLIGTDDVLEAALRASTKAGLPNIQVSPALGKLLYLLVKLHSAKNVLEIGTLGGYSTIWMARALPKDGHLISLELNDTHAQVAQKNLDVAGLGALATVKTGPALNSLAQIAKGGDGPFDFFFIDADKESIPLYFEWAIKLGRPGAIIVVDNVVRDGAILEENSSDRAVQGLRKLNEMIRSDDRVDATALQTVGCKGYDGFLIARIKGD